jgi:hypothetical protein
MTDQQANFLKMFPEFEQVVSNRRAHGLAHSRERMLLPDGSVRPVGPPVPEGSVLIGVREFRPIGPS